MNQKAWGAYYGKVGGEVDRFLGELCSHRKFTSSIMAANPRTTLEVGCGTARTSVFLSYLGVKATALDRDDEVIENAQKINTALNGRVTFVKGDAFHLPFEKHAFDVVLHQGVLEHFDDENIRRLLREQLRVARTVVFSVPNQRYPTRDFGDERLLARRKWERILAPFRLAESRDYLRRRTPLARFLPLEIRRKIMYLARIE